MFRLHELATNATKYGALSVPGGRVTISWRLDEAAGQLLMAWVEAGGPSIKGPPAARGFGSRVIEGTLRQLGGDLTLAWPVDGLICELRLSLVRLLAKPATTLTAG